VPPPALTALALGPPSELVPQLTASPTAGSPVTASASYLA
jgi:hypothetical protein